MTKTSKRYQKRLERADKLCREFRYLISTNGMVVQGNSDRIMKLLAQWMNVAGKDRYIRP